MVDARIASADLAITFYPLTGRRSQIVADLTSKGPVEQEAELRAEKVCATLVDTWGGAILDRHQIPDVKSDSAPGLVQARREIHADPDALWALIGDRYRFNVWHPMIRGSLALHDGRHRRDLLEGLEEGGTLEKFLYQNAAQRTYTYAKVADDSIDTAWSSTKVRYFFPFTAYVAQLSVIPDETGGSIVTWSGWLTFDSGADELTRESACAQSLRFYNAGLDALVNHPALRAPEN